MDPEELNTSLHSSITPSHLVGFHRFRSPPLSSQSRNQARTPLSSLLIFLFRSSVQQQTLWRLSYFQPSKFTCFHTQTYTVSDPDTLPLQRTNDIATGFNQRKPPHCTVCVAVDLTATFDNQPQLIIKDCKINTAGGDQSIAVKLLKRQTISYKLQRCKVKGKDSPHWRTARLSNVSNVIKIYLADLPRPTEPIKRICYADHNGSSTERYEGDTFH